MVDESMKIALRHWTVAEALYFPVFTDQLQRPITARNRELE